MHIRQFTRSGHTQLRGNAIMITSTITVVLFSTVVRRPFLLFFLVFFPEKEPQKKKGPLVCCPPTIGTFIVDGQVFGLLTKPLIRVLLPSGMKRQNSLSSDPSTPKSLFAPLLGGAGEQAAEGEAAGGQSPLPRPTSIRMLLSTPTHTVHHYWRKFDDAVMRPMFGGRGFAPFVPGSPTERSVHPW